MGRTDLDEREQAQQYTFDAFLRTQPSEIRSADWTPRGLGPPIDFISTETRIGVELTEWRGQAQSKWVEDRDRFRGELLAAIEEQGLTAFRPGGAGYTAQIYLHDGPPGRRNKPRIVTDLLNFLADFVRTKRPRFAPHRIAYILAPELPVSLRSCVDFIIIYEFPAPNIEIVLHKKGTDFDPSLAQPVSDLAINSFRERIREKTIAGATRYAREKESLQLLQLWLVVHSPGVFPEPMFELGMEIGYGKHKLKSQEAVAEKLKPITEELGRGPFDRIYFLVDRQPHPFAQLIFVK